MVKLKLGLIVNPLAGLGGSVALKGSDGGDIVAEALHRGAVPLAMERTARALTALSGENVELLCWGGAMGGNSAMTAGLDARILQVPPAVTSAADTRQAVQTLLDAGIDLLVFSGGDGTARDILTVLGHRCPVLGIPAGCKMHSAVYANNPEDAGRLLARLVRGELVELTEAEVRDIDETAFRQGRVRARHYGSLMVPRSDDLLQQVKSGGQTDDRVALVDMAAFVVDMLDDDVDYLMGSGSTVAEVMQQLNLPNTLLGVDLVRNGACIAQDLTARDILELTGEYPLHAVLTVIGGQGHLFGRGNQQFTPEVIRHIGRDNLHIIATRGKLLSLQGRPFRLDSGDAGLDQQLEGWISVLCGYDERVLYRVGGHC